MLIIQYIICLEFHFLIEIVCNLIFELKNRDHIPYVFSHLILSSIANKPLFSVNFFMLGFVLSKSINLLNTLYHPFIVHSSAL